MRRRTRAVALLCAGVLGAGALGGCGSGSGSAATGGTATVFAAASLTGAFTDLKERFEAAHPGRSVRLNFGASSTLVTQLTHGAPADVFASADQANMDKAVKAGVTDGTPSTFARNSLALIVRPGNPKRITGLADLRRGGIVVSLCAPAVPAGRYAAQAFAKARVPAPRAGGETDVKQVVTRVSLGEADAGVVYVTDARAAGSRVSTVAIPPAHNVTAAYPASVIKGGPDTAAGRAFLAFLTSAAGRTVLAGHGFQSP
ncbi:molybdate ABC transporter substrate-binding protein [Spirillospora sp. NPDC047279]|uniref:molybdate ABC transporter substrate-binding protein n=1 Tax=Spirillospora sp. NPDC047279 TaxID=3155478 RepID=UPI003405BE47